MPRNAARNPDALTEQGAVLACIPDEDRGIFLALAHLGLRPGEARALTLADSRDGWLFVDKAAKSKASGAEIRGIKTGKPKRLPVSEDLAAWIEARIDPVQRFSPTPLFPTRRYARLADHALIEVLPPAKAG